MQLIDQNLQRQRFCGVYPAPEKLEIIRLVEQSYLSLCRTLEKLGIRPATVYRWYDRL